MLPINGFRKSILLFLNQCEPVLLSPGEYLMQIVVTDENAGKKKPPVAQWVDFEVVAARDSM